MPPFDSSASQESSSPDKEKCVNLIVRGTVQGVFFRASTLEKAQSLNLMGWVANLPEGAVEVVAVGPRYALEHLIDWCNHGPPMAKVNRVEVNWTTSSESFKTFMIR